MPNSDSNFILPRNRRHSYVMKDFLVPIIAGIVLGGLTSYATLKFNEGETRAWRISVEKQISAMEVVLRAVQANQLELASRGQWMLSTEDRLDKLESDMTDMFSSRYTKKDGERDMKSIIREIKLRHMENPDK